MSVIDTINVCNIAYDAEYTHSLREYYLYCISLFKGQLQLISKEINIIFGDFDHDFKNVLSTKRIVFQYEHTLVKPGGRDSEGFPVGKVLIDDKNSYLVRLVNYDKIVQSDLVVEYSIPNRYHVGWTNYYPAYNSRSLHISACLYDIDFDSNRTRNVVTNFYDATQPRRHELLKRIGSVNFTGVYGEQLANLYSSAKVLINIHQTDHHDTLEELRVLPALRRGAVVVAEHSALERLVPYHDHIIWASYNEIPDVVEDVLNNYDRYRERIFNDRLRDIFERLEQSNLREVKRGLERLC